MRAWEALLSAFNNWYWRERRIDVVADQVAKTKQLGIYIVRDLVAVHLRPHIVSIS